jgi:hypothetical protein
VKTASSTTPSLPLRSYRPFCYQRRDTWPVPFSTGRAIKIMDRLRLAQRTAYPSPHDCPVAKPACSGWASWITGKAGRERTPTSAGAHSRDTTSEIPDWDFCASASMPPTASTAVYREL